MRCPLKRFSLYAAIALAALVFSGSFANAETTESDPVTQLGSREPQEPEKAQKRIAGDRETMIARLLQIARIEGKPVAAGKERVFVYKSADSSRRRAVMLLGELRAAEAVDLLAQIIATQMSSGATSIAMLEDYPSVQALIQIGTPSLTAILRRLAPEGDGKEAKALSELELHLFAFVIHRIDGNEVGEFRLQTALKTAKSDAEKSSIKQLLAIYIKNESESALNRFMEVEARAARPATVGTQ